MTEHNHDAPLPPHKPQGEELAPLPVPEAQAIGGAPAPVHATNGLAIAALVVGIVAFISGWLPVWGLLVGIAAVVLAILGLRKPTGKGLAIAGLVTGGLGLLTGLAMTAILIVGIIFGTSDVARQAIEQAADESQNQSTAVDDSIKKDFAKGETATFNNYEVKVNSTSDFTPSNSYTRPADGYKFIAVNMTVKNISDESASISPYRFDVLVDGVATDASYADVEGKLVSGDILPGASTTGTVIYEVPTGATDIKLHYNDYVYKDGSYTATQVDYTLAI